MSSPPETSVARRRVFYIPGYDPFQARRYRELYRKEGAAQAAISGYTIGLSAKTIPGTYGWHVDAEIDGERTRTDVDVLVWSDLVCASMSDSIPATYGQLFRTAWIYISTGALWRLMRLRKGPVIAALYPVCMLLLQAMAAFLLAWIVYLLITWAFGFVRADSLAGLPVLHQVAGIGAGAVAAFRLMRRFKAWDRRFFAHYLMHDYAYAAALRGANQPELEARMAEFADLIAESLGQGYDEVLVVGHSSGAHLGVSVLADLIRGGRVPRGGPALALLTLGQVMPMVAFLPEATRLRADLRYLSARDELTWVDVSAPGDGCAFALCDPVTVAGVAPSDKRWPLVISAAFTQTLSPEAWRKLRRRSFRLHFQYLCAFDRPKDYDYFRLTAGPLTLARRYEGRPPSRSRIERPVSKHTSVGRMTDLLPPKPASRPDRVSLWRYLRLFRQDLLSAQPARLYRGWMAEFRTPFFRSYLLNQPDLVRAVLKDRPRDFPKSARVAEGLRPLLGNSVFLTNGETWERQRRIIDPAFAGGRLRDTFPAIREAAAASARRMGAQAGRVVEIEPETSHAAADVIFRTLFSIPIDHEIARRVFDAFGTFQRSQPLVNLAALLPLPGWMPRILPPGSRASARRIRTLIADLTQVRAAAIADGSAPDDLVTKIMTRTDPVTGERFTPQEVVDQVAIFFLAGHETSASALGWALYLLAAHPDWQDRLAQEAQALDTCDFAVMSKLRVTRDVFREALRLYPPVPMMVRQATCPETFRCRPVARGAQVVLSPWHLHRHARLWDAPDTFDPGRWHTENGAQCAREAFSRFPPDPASAPAPASPWSRGR